MIFNRLQEQRANMKGFEKMLYNARDAFDKVGDRVVSFGDAIGEATNRAVNGNSAKSRQTRGNSLGADEFDESAEHNRRSRKTSLASIPEGGVTSSTSGRTPEMQEVDLEDSPYGYSMEMGRRPSGRQRPYTTIRDEESDHMPSVNNPMVNAATLEENDQYMFAAAVNSSRSPRTPPPSSSGRLNAQQAAARNAFNLQSPIK
jgi:hypothetical protein